MKNLLLCCSTLVATLLFGKSGVVPPADWVAEGYQYNMTFYAQVLRPDGTYIDHERSVLAVFDEDGECRGAISPIEGPNGWLYQLGISSDSVEEEGLTFKILDAVTGETYPVAETVNFANDAIVPEDGIVNPLQLHVPENVVMVRLKPGWNLVSLPCVLSQDDESVLLTLCPFAEEDGGYVRATTLEPNRGYWFFVTGRTTFVLVPQEGSAPETQLGAGWNLVGTADAEPSWLEQVARPFFRWDAEKGFVPAEMPEVKAGYWVKAK